jgi:hypothetical protein
VAGGLLFVFPPFVKLTLARMKERNIADIVVPWLSANAFNN